MGEFEGEGTDKMIMDQSRMRLVLALLIQVLVKEV